MDGWLRHELFPIRLYTDRETCILTTTSRSHLVSTYYLATYETSNWILKWRFPHTTDDQKPPTGRPSKSPFASPHPHISKAQEISIPQAISKTVFRGYLPVLRYFTLHFLHCISSSMLLNSCQFHSYPSREIIHLHIY